MKQVWKDQLWIVAVAAPLLFWNLGVPRLWDDDEPRNAQCAREMLARDDLVVPRFNQELRPDKPALLYWLMIGAYQVFGDNEFAARFWSALLAVGTSLSTYHIGRLLFSAPVGKWAAIVLVSSLMFGVTGRAATPDSTLIFFTTLSMLALAALVVQKRGHSTFSEKYNVPFFHLVPAFAAMGLAVLAKGPVGVVLPMGVFIVYVWSLRESAPPATAGASLARRAWQRVVHWCRPLPWLASVWHARPLLALAVVGAIALPWYIAVGLRTDGAWLSRFLGEHNVGRFLAPMERHGGPIFYYIPAIAIGFFPWSVFLPAAIWHAARTLRKPTGDTAGTRFVLAWAGTYVAFFSLALTKLPSYVLPSYPALALMTAAYLHAWATNPARYARAARWAYATTTVVGACMAVGLGIAAAILLPGEWPIGLVGLAPLVGGGAAWLLARRGDVRRAQTVFAVAAVVLVFSALSLASVRVSRHHNSVSLVAKARQIGTHEAPLATCGYTVPSLVYYANSRVPAVNRDRDVQDLFANEHNALLLTTSRRLEKLRAALPPDVAVLARERRFLRREDVVLIGRPTATARGESTGTQR